MGSKFHEILQAEVLKIRDLAGSTVAVDATSWLHQFLKVKRRGGNEPTRLQIMDGTMTLINHLRNFLYRTIFFLENDVWPVYVFDGADSIKMRNVKHRRDHELYKLHEHLKALHQDAMDLGWTELARNIGQNFVFSYPIAESESKILLAHLGMPVVTAPGEAEAQCAWLEKNGHVDMMLSSDMDALLFGARHVIRRIHARKNSHGGNVELYDLEKILATLGLDESQFLDLAILVGTDHNPGIRRIGAKTALSLLSKHRTIEEIARNEPSYDWTPLGLQGTRNRTSSSFLDDLRARFLQPVVREDIPALEWLTPDEGGLAHLLLEQHGFSKKVFQGALDRLHRAVS